MDSAFFTFANTVVLLVGWMTILLALACGLGLVIQLYMKVFFAIVDIVSEASGQKAAVVKASIQVYKQRLREKKKRRKKNE